MVEKIYRLQCECGNEIAEGKTRLECLKNARDAELVVRGDKAFGNYIFKFLTESPVSKLNNYLLIEIL
jgi:hypothetical protein